MSGTSPLPFIALAPQEYILKASNAFDHNVPLVSDCMQWDPAHPAHTGNGLNH